MAKAPAPGSTSSQLGPSSITLRLRDERLEFIPAAVPLIDKIAVRQATDLPYESFVGNTDRIGEDSIAVLWWIARRQNGEPRLAFKDVMAAWVPLTSEDEVDVIVVDDSGEDTDDPKD